jgi:hypothetical protein
MSPHVALRYVERGDSLTWMQPPSVTRSESDRDLPLQARLFINVDATYVTCVALNWIGNPMPEASPQWCGAELDWFRRLVLNGVARNRIGDPMPEVCPQQGVEPDWDSCWNMHQTWGLRQLCFLDSFQVLQCVCRHHLWQTPGLSRLLLGGGMYLRQTPQAGAKAPASLETGVWHGGRTIWMGVLSAHQPPLVA